MRFVVLAMAGWYAAVSTGAVFGALDWIAPKKKTVQDPNSACAQRGCGCPEENHADSKCCCAPDPQPSAPKSGATVIVYHAIEAECQGQADVKTGKPASSDQESPKPPKISIPTPPTVPLLSIHKGPAKTVAAHPPDKVPIAAL